MLVLPSPWHLPFVLLALPWWWVLWTWFKGILGSLAHTVHQIHSRWWLRRYGVSHTGWVPWWWSNRILWGLFQPNRPWRWLCNPMSCPSKWTASRVWYDNPIWDVGCVPFEQLPSSSTSRVEVCSVTQVAYTYNSRYCIRAVLQVRIRGVVCPIEDHYTEVPVYQGC